MQLNSSHAEDKILQMTYAGAILHNEWICSDIGITSGSTIKSALKDSDQPVLLINCCYNGLVKLSVYMHIFICKQTGPFHCKQWFIAIYTIVGTL